jgi:uncharacterized membrane protein HdeD (DUF308 family)
MLHDVDEEVAPMRALLIHNWPGLALRGALALLIGIVAFGWPLVTLSALVFLFGGYAIVDGAITVLSGTHRRHSHKWHMVVEGLLGIAAGAAAILWTGITTVALISLIAAWAILTGLPEVVLAVRLRRELPGAPMLGLAGLASIALGVVLFLRPAAGALAIILLFGAYATVFGLAMLTLAVRLRSFDAPHRGHGHMFSTGRF